MIIFRYEIIAEFCIYQPGKDSRDLQISRKQKSKWPNKPKRVIVRR